MKKKPFKFFWEDDAWNELDRMHENIHRMMRDLWSGFSDLRISSYFPIDLAETKDKLIVRADLPGVDKKNVSVRILDNRLIIDAEQSEEKKDVAENYFRQERRYGSFHREIELPVEVDENGAKAEMKNGVLTIEIPKKKKVKKRGKEIKIK